MMRPLVRTAMMVALAGWVAWSPSEAQTPARPAAQERQAPGFSYLGLQPLFLPMLRLGGGAGTASDRAGRPAGYGGYPAPGAAAQGDPFARILPAVASPAGAQNRGGVGGGQAGMDAGGYPGVISTLPAGATPTWSAPPEGPGSDWSSTMGPLLQRAGVSSAMGIGNIASAFSSLDRAADYAELMVGAGRGGVTPQVINPATGAPVTLGTPYSFDAPPPANASGWTQPAQRDERPAAQPARGGRVAPVTANEVGELRLPMLELPVYELELLGLPDLWLPSIGLGAAGSEGAGGPGGRAASPFGRAAGPPARAAAPVARPPAPRQGGAPPRPDVGPRA